MLITMKNIYDWAGENEAQRKFIEGDRVFKAGHVILCGEVERNQNGEVMIVGSCLQTSHMRDKPHDITGKIAEEGLISEFKCSCKAGLSGQCKHILATLLKIYTQEKLDELSCTDKKCQWKDKQKLLLQKYEVIPLYKEECFSKKNKIITEELQNNTRKALFNIISHNLPYSAVCKQVQGRHNAFKPKPAAACSPDDKIRIEKIFLLQDHQLMEDINKQNYTLSLDCCKEHVAKLQGNTYEICDKTKLFYDEWIKERCLRITGSICYSLYTYLSNKNPNWNKKLEDVFYPKSFKNNYTEYGKVTEEKAREAYINLTKYNVLCPGLVVSACNPWLAYSPDGVIFNGDIPVGLLEIKCPFVGKKSNINETVISCVGKCLENRNGELTLKKKHPYYGQVQLGMAVINVMEADFVIYSLADNKVFIIRIKRDYYFLIQMLSSLKKLYFEKIIHFHCLRKKEIVVLDKV